MTHTVDRDSLAALITYVRLRVDDPNWCTADGVCAIVPIDALRAILAALPETDPDGLVLVREGTGGVFPDGTTNDPPIDFDAAPQVAALPETPDLDVEVVRLRAVAALVRRHTHQGLYAMTRHTGDAPEDDCLLCRALVSAGVLTLDEIGAGTRAALREERTK